MGGDGLIRVICNHFADPTFSRLAAALEASIERNAPGVVYDEWISPTPKEVPGLLRHYTDNHAKLLIWNEAVQSAEDSEHIVLMDADTIVLGPLDDAFEHDFDVAWTWRPGRLPVNSGVVFIKVNDRSRAFMDAWVGRDHHLMTTRGLADHGKRKYGGANQASFMWLALHGGGKDICKLDGKSLPCRKWNSVDQTWCDFNDDTRILHIKGKLRDACVGGEPSAFFKGLKLLSVSGMESDIEMNKLADIWRQYDCEVEA